MNNEFLDLAASPIMNLDHTYRYSGTKLVEAESLSQHIVDTIMMGLKIIDKINHIAEKVLVYPTDYLMKAVYHDLEEVITGDIPRPVKYYSDATRDSLKGVAESVAHRFFNDQFYEGDTHYKIWDNAKEGPAGYILKIVDTLVVANKVVKEVSLLNNMYMLRVAHEVSQYLVIQLDNIKCKSTSYFNEPNVNDYLANILEGAIYVMEGIMSEHRECMSSLNISAQSMI